MKNRLQSLLLTFYLISSLVTTAQDCKTTAELDVVPGKYLTAAQYPWPAARAEYYSKMNTAADKAMAKKVLEQIEKTEQKSHLSFNLTGGNWENYFSTDGYGYLANNKLGQYSFQSALYEFFCSKQKLVRNSEFSTVLRIYVNKIPVNTLNRFLRNPFGTEFGKYDLGLQYLDWKNHQPANVDDQLIRLFTYFSSSSNTLIEAINSGKNYFQDVDEKDIRPNNRSNHIYRYWFLKKSDLLVLVPVSRKEYLHSLLEYYEREKLYFPKLINKLIKDRDNSVKQYDGWEDVVNEKIEIVKNILTSQKEDWLLAQAVINQLEDQSLNYKAELKERINYKRFWRFYDNEKKSEGIYKYNPGYFRTSSKGVAAPQLIAVVFRYVTIPSSLRILENFHKNFNFGELRALLQ